MPPKVPPRSFMKHWYAVEAIPIFAIIGGAMLGATWYITRLARGPTIVWTKDNPTPWNSIEQNQGTKLINVNQKFDKDWKRDKL